MYYLSLNPGAVILAGKRDELANIHTNFGRNHVEMRWGIEYFGLDNTSGDEEALDMAEKTTHHVMPMLSVGNTTTFRARTQR